MNRLESIENLKKEFANQVHNCSLPILFNHVVAKDLYDLTKKSKNIVKFLNVPFHRTNTIHARSFERYISKIINNFNN